MINYQRTFLSLFLFISITTGCNQVVKEKPDNTAKDSELILYFKKNNWEYPIQIDTSGIQYDKNIKLNPNVNPSILKQKIKEWCISDSLLSKHSKDQSLRIYEIELTQIKLSKYRLTCRIDFYREGQKINGVVAPVEGHGIVENKFLRQKEIAIFILDNDKLIFSNWHQ